jgi:hypothetical protein
MNHNHIYYDSVSCEQLKAVDIIFKEEGHVNIKASVDTESIGILINWTPKDIR